MKSTRRSAFGCDVPEFANVSRGIPFGSGGGRSQASCVEEPALSFQAVFGVVPVQAAVHEARAAVAPDHHGAAPRDRPRSPPDAAERLDATIGRLQLRRTLGAGGMGIVYAAHDPKLDREVAVKLIRSDHRDAQLRLEREAQALAKLSHPNVVAIHDVGVHRGQIWLSMEFVVGRTLGDWIEGERPR